MKLRQNHAIEAAAAKAGISRATDYRLVQDPVLPSQKRDPRGRRRPDPLELLFEAEVVPLLRAAPGLRPVAIYEELLRRHPDLHLVYGDKLFPRPEYRRAFEALCAAMPERTAYKITVELLALAHERNCEAELASELGRVLHAGALPDLAALRRRFSPDPADLPQVFVQPVCLDSYQILVGTQDMAGQRA